MKYSSIITMILLVLAAFALPALLRSHGFASAKHQASRFVGHLRADFAPVWLMFGPRLVSAANDTYDAAVEVHESSVTRTNDVAVTARHLLWTQGASAGTVKLATAALPALGTIDNTEASTAVRQSILLLGKGDTKKMVASEAIAAGAYVYQAAAGKVATSGTILVGTALTASAADDDLLEVQDIPATTLASVETVAATNVILPSESGKTFFLGHATEFVSTLPAPAAGLRFTFIVSLAPSGASYTIVTTGGTDLIHGVAVSAADAGGSVDTTAGTPADTITFVDGQAGVGDRVELISDGTYWYASGVCSDEDAITFTQS